MCRSATHPVPSSREVGGTVDMYRCRPVIQKLLQSHRGHRCCLACLQRWTYRFGACAETVGCTTVSFTDAPGMVVCAPVGNTWTTAEEWLEVIAAWSECEEGVGAGCEAAANEYFSKNTGCASCGGLAHELLNGLKVCCTYLYLYQAMC